MSEKPVADQRVLVIDDRDGHRLALIRYLEGISEDMRRQYGIGDFKIEEADSVATAKQLLEQSAHTPYDLAFLDLQLPINDPKDDDKNAQYGLSLLDFIRETQTAKGVVVVSAYEEFLKAGFTGGAIDFIGKPVEQENFEPAVLNAVQRLTREESERILNQRVRDLVAYAEIGLAHSFKLVFNNLLDGVTEAAHGVEKYVRERYGLDKEKDPYDPLILNLRAHAKAVSRARQDWAGLQATLTRGGKTLESGDVGRMLHDLKESLLPCLVVKNVVLTLPDSSDMQVMTFENDVEIVLREIIVGMLSELPDYGQGSIKVSLMTEDTRAQVRFEDNLDPIPEEQMEAINEGRRILPDAKFGRAWGLSVAQHVALRGGGELIVKTERGRNVVTYHVPLANYE